jgi:hypothetical protein
MPAAGGAWRSVERISIVAPLGIRFWDTAFNVQINDGLTVTAYPRALADQQQPRSVASGSGSR